MKIKNLRDALEAKIDALPGTDNQKHAILNMTAYAAGAAFGLTAMIVTFKAGQKFTTED